MIFPPPLTTSTAVMDYACATDVVTLPTERLNRVTEVNILRVHIVFATELACFQEYVAPYHQTCAGNHFDGYWFNTLREQRCNPPDFPPGPANLQRLDIHNLIEYGRKTLNAASLNRSVGVQKLTS